MKYIYVFVAIMILVISGCVVLNSNLLPAGEIFEGTGQGYRGQITVQVRMDGAEITEIAIVNSEEDRFVGAEAIEELADLIILYNSTDIDVISGATESSRGFLEAVENAIMKNKE